MNLGTNLGRLIYFMDAAVDYETDIKSGLFNPFVEILDADKIDEATAHDIKDKLMVLAGQATQHFEKLPLEQDLHLLQNFLYEGLGIQFNHKFLNIKLEIISAIIKTPSWITRCFKV